MNFNKNPAKFGKQQLTAIAAILIVGTGAAAYILNGGKSKPEGDGHGHEQHSEAKEHADGEHHGAKAADAHDHDKGHADDEHHEKAPGKGPHGGSLFADGDASVEVALSEVGGEPHFQVWGFNKNQPVAANQMKIIATLTRADGERMDVSFGTVGAELKSWQAIEEPHVFDAAFVATMGQQTVRFTFSREEGKIELNDAQIKAAGISIATSAPARIKSSMQLPGEIRFNEDRTAHVVPRVAGVVESVAANLGQPVKKGQLLAVIASSTVSEQRSEFLSAQKRLALAKTTFDREKKLWEEKISAEQDYLQAQQALREAEIAVANSQQKLVALGAIPSATTGLNRYELRAPFDGVIVEKHIAMGESVKEDAQVFTVSDLSSVWTEISVPARDLPLVRVGETVSIKAFAFDSKAAGKVAYVGALIGEQTRTALARVTLANPQGVWRPGLFVNVELTAAENEVPVSVSADAIQTLADKPVIFLKVKGGFVAQPVETGRSDGKLTEVVKGLKAGASYAAAGSFVVKSELGKASAEHSH
jgi:cobalt-zinc-cadmium efflux system membrane fusion protein